MIHHETEADTRANRIDPVLRAAGWGVVEGSRVRREHICPGRIAGRGRLLPGADLCRQYIVPCRVSRENDP